MTRAMELAEKYKQGGAEIIGTFAVIDSYQLAVDECDDIFCGDVQLTEEDYEAFRAGYYWHNEGFYVVFSDDSCLGGVPSGDSEGTLKLLIADSVDEFVNKYKETAKEEV